MPNILVAGGSGSIGKHLCSSLIKDSNDKIICLSRTIKKGLENEINPLNSKNFQVIKGDITNPNDLSKVGDIDQIYNLGCNASPGIYTKNPIATLKANSIGVFNLIELAIKKNAKFLHTSSTEGLTGANATGSRATYSLGKQFSELITDMYKENGVDAKVAKLSNVYGTALSKADTEDKRVIPIFINKALNNENLTLYKSQKGAGEQVRYFGFVDDIVNGLIGMMNTKNKINKPIDLGGSKPITIEDLAKKIITFSNSKSKINLVDPPAGINSPPGIAPDITDAKKIFGWEPKVDIDTGLKKTIKSFKSFSAEA